MVKIYVLHRHSPTAQAAYHDLVSILLDDALSDMQGSPTIREINGRCYWYDRYQIGNEMHERYLGEDNPGTRERVDRFKTLRQGQVNRRRERTRLVRLLRSERFLGMDGATGSLVAALARVGAFRHTHSAPGKICHPQTDRCGQASRRTRQPQG